MYAVNNEKKAVCTSL